MAHQYVRNENSLYWFTIILTVRVPVTYKATHSYSLSVRQTNERGRKEEKKKRK